MGLERQISAQTNRLLSCIGRKRGPVNSFISLYFTNFQGALPVINIPIFNQKLNSDALVQDAYFSTLLLCMFLLTRLSGSTPEARKDGDELYLALKSIYCLLQSGGKVKEDLVRIGLLLASWEYCQGMLQDAWLTVGGCARMANVLGLHLTVKEWGFESGVEKVEWDIKRVIWWCVVILERVVGYTYTEDSLPLASKGPELYYILPDQGERVSADLITPDMTEDDGINLYDRPFTKSTPFDSSIQAIFLYDCTMKHVQTRFQKASERRADALRIDAALRSFGVSLIPPPHGADGQFVSLIPIQIPYFLSGSS